MQDLDVSDLKRISELIYDRYRYDFRNYAISSFKRRVARILELNDLSLACLLKKLSETPLFIHEFIDELTVNVTEMFRDPGFWDAMRNTVIPAIREKKTSFRIWHAGCSSGEEVLTMCILLKEMGALDEAFITATDIDTNMLQRARTVSIPMKNMPLNEMNYSATGRPASGLQEYYVAKNGQAVFHRDLVKQVSFAVHDLVMGEVFEPFDLILCRNVMIYFNQELQNDVVRKLHGSLAPEGFLSLGARESLIGCDYGNRLSVVCQDEKIYRKLKK